MSENKRPACPNCGRAIQKEVYTIGGKVYCEACRPDDDRTMALMPDEETLLGDERTVMVDDSGGEPLEQDSRTVALVPDDDELTIADVGSATVTQAPADGKTMAMPADELTIADAGSATVTQTPADGKTMAMPAEGRTIAAGGSADDATLADGVTIEVSEASQPSPSTFMQGNATQATTYMTMNKSVAATRVIEEMLKIKPDVDLEQTSKIYFAERGLQPKGDDTPIQELISRSGEEKKYIYDRELGRGGMGAVYSTVDQDIRRKVAMKVMLPGVSRSQQHIKRFLEEAQVTGQLEHPNIVPVHDIGIDEEQKIYFTMKMVKGENLEDIVAKVAENAAGYRERYGLGALLQIFMKICDGLSYSHSKGVLHRDLKPENIMVGDFGEAMIMDWGLAKVLGRSEAGGDEAEQRIKESQSAYQTLEGQVMGTPSYMSPEQARGQISELDERSDIFSLGGILYKILTCQAPYKGRNAREALDKARKRLLQPPDVRAPENNIPAELNAICLKAMARDKDDRYATAQELKQDLQLYLDGRSVSAKRDSIPVIMKKWVIRNKVAAMGIAASIVCLIAGLIGTSVYFQKEKQAEIGRLLASGREAQAQGSFESAEETYFAVLGLDSLNDEARRGIAQVSGKALAMKNRRLAREKLIDARRLFDAGEFIKAYDAFVSTFALDPESADARAGIQAAAVKADRQKAQQKIAPILEETRQLTQRRESIAKQLGLLEIKVDKLRGTISGYEDYKVKKPLWDAERSMLEQRIAKLKTEGEIISKYSTILSFDGQHPAARRALASFYYEKYLEAEALQQAQDKAYYRELILTFDDGTYRRLLAQVGTLTITTSPAADSFYLFRFIEGADRRLVPAPFSPAAFASAPGGANAGIAPAFKLAGTPFRQLSEMLTFEDVNRLQQLAGCELPAGSYLLIARKQGYVDTRLPVLIKRGEEQVLRQVRLLKQSDIPPGFVYVPKGSFIMGGDPAAPYAVERTEKMVNGFLVSRREVTLGDYIEFVNFYEARRPGAGEQFLPRKAETSGFYFKKTGSTYRIDLPAAWPALGVSWNDARAYCRWMTLQNREKGWEFRLPEDWEWEKAARGVDGRAFPWGNYFDYRFASMANSTKEAREGPSPVGSFALDESVYGVQDMAGNINEWCNTFYDQDNNMRIFRGAAWSYVDQSYARCAARNGQSPPAVADFRGFRIALSLKE